MRVKVERAAGWAAVCLMLTAGGGAAVQIEPIYGLQMLGGQNFYSGQKGNLSGNLNAIAAPAMKLDERWAFLPSVNTAYQGTEQVLDVVGAGTLFQEQWDNRASAVGVYTPTGSLWRLKPSASFKYELLKETKNEDWGRGLFDYYKWDLGFDAEYLYHEPFTLRAGIDYFQTAFPNYTSLESQAATSFQGQSLARELVGDHVLDTQNVMVMAGADAPVFERMILQGSFSILYERFPNQHLVDGSGSLVSPLRRDVVTSAAVGLRMPTELNSDLRLLGALDLSGGYDSSNQNSYDATQTRFLPYFYNYGELRFSPSFKALMGPARQPVVFGLAGTWWYRRYPYRPTQDASGVYSGTAIHTSNWMLSASLTYPMVEHFSLLFNLQRGWAGSNQHFEQFYRYNYTVTNYLFGFSYDY